MSKDPSVRAMELLFQRVPYGVEVVWIPNGEEVYSVLHPLANKVGPWLWKGERKPTYPQEHSDPTFQTQGFRVWSMDKGKLMVGTKAPDIEKMRKWVESL